MRSKVKKILMSLVIVFLLGTSVGHAGSMPYNRNMYFGRYNSWFNGGRYNNNVQSRPVNPSPNTNVDSSNMASSIEMEVVRLVNIERQKSGLAPFTYSKELSNVAQAKSQDMASNNYFSHHSPSYGDPFAMMRSFGIQYKTAGENIAKGYSSAQSVVNGWMNSSGHRANILNPSFGKIGVGYVNFNGTSFWTQMFTD